MIDWSLDPVFGSYALVVLAAIGLGVLLLLVRESTALTRRQRFFLWLMRFIVCLLVLLLLLRPGLTFTKQSTPRGSIAVMMDQSTSMQLAAGEGKQTRWEAQLEVWNEIWKAREQLGEDTTIVPFLYDSKLYPLGEFETKEAKVPPVLPAGPQGLTTDIGGPLQQVASTSMKSPLMAMIWMGDGAQTKTPAAVDPQEIARQLARIDVPMYLIGLGPRSDSETARDLSLEELPEQLDAFAKSQLPVKGFIRCRGVTNRDVTLKLLMMQVGGVPRVIDQITVRPNRSDQKLPFQFPLTAPDAGAYELIVRAEPVEGEATDANNQMNVYLNVRAGGIRVLYLEAEGAHPYEFGFIKRSIADSKDIQMQVRIIANEELEKRSGRGWPIDLSQLLSNRVFDCLILGDVDYDAIGNEGAKMIAEQVKLGMGLVTLGGYHSYSAGGWDASPLAAALPVTMARGVRQGNRLGDRIELRNHYEEPMKLVPRTSDKILQLGEPGSDMMKLWAEMVPLSGANRWEGPRNLPGVQVLAQSDTGHPLIVTGGYDRGRVVSLAFDSTYRWFRQGKAREHKQFWRQILMWCLRRETIEEGMQLEMSQRRLLMSQPAELTLKWNGGTAESEMPTSALLHLWKLGDPARNGPEGEDKDLGEFNLVRRDADTMKLSYAGAKESGRYEWRAKTSGSKGQELFAKLPFAVFDQSLESLQPMPDWQMMAQLAKLNSSAGGELIVPEQTSAVIRRILDRRRQATETAVENRRLGDGSLDTWTIFALLVGVLLLQWGMRKKWNLP